MIHAHFRLGSLVLAGSLACAALACGAEDSSTEPGETSADATSAALKPGTYVLDGEPAHWVIKQIVLGSDGRYTVQMYPGVASPLDAVKTTTGTYSQEGGKLVVRFEKGNEFNSWTVKKRGSRFTLTDTGNGNAFTLRLSSTSTVFDPGPPLGSDPGKPRHEAGTAAISCHSEVGDIWLNAVVSREGTGSLYLSSASSLGLEAVEHVALSPERATDEWVRLTGDGAVGSEPKRYLVNLPTDFVEAGGSELGVSLLVGSAVYESDPFVSWGLLCDSTGVK